MRSFTFLLVCLFWSSFSNAEILSHNVENLAFGQELWHFQVQGQTESYELKARVYPPTNLRVNFWDSKKTPDNLMIFSTIDGSGPLEKTLARYFARRNFWVVLPLIPELENPFDEQTASRMDIMYQRVQQSAQVLQSKLQQVNPRSREFLMGGSRGGIRSLMAAQVLKDIEAVWVNAAGGGFPSLYAHSEVDEISDFRRGHMNYLGFEDAQNYQDFLSSRLQYDPLFNCDKIEARLSFVVALEDSSVPTANQLQLLKACQPEKIKTLDAGHLRGVLDMVLNKRDIRKFFEQN